MHFIVYTRGFDLLANFFDAGVAPLIFLLLVLGCSARPLYPLPSRRNDKTKQPLQTFRPYNVAHRGSNGEIPEETAAAYMVRPYAFTFANSSTIFKALY